MHKFAETVSFPFQLIFQKINNIRLKAALKKAQQKRNKFLI